MVHAWSPFRGVDRVVPVWGGNAATTSGGPAGFILSSALTRADTEEETMKIRRLWITLIAAVAVACASAPLPSAVRVADLAVLAGTYSGTTETTGMGNRATRVVVRPTGDFEIAVADPDGFRRLGKISIASSGDLRYAYDEVKSAGKVESKGGVTFHEGGGRRVLVLTRDGGEMTSTVSSGSP
jgi:hypothetical protein